MTSRCNGDEDAPISIVVTTLGGHAYRGHESVYETLVDLLERMPAYVEYDSHNLPYVRNPTNPLENFAEKWHEHPRKREVFEEWILQARADLKSLSAASLSRSHVPLEKFLGEREAGHALRAYGDSMNKRRQSGLRVATGTGLLGVQGPGSASIQQNTFFGS